MCFLTQCLAKALVLTEEALEMRAAMVMHKRMFELVIFSFLK